MSEKFKKQLKAYAAGELPEEERIRVEQELEKLEIYQQYLDEVLGEDPSASGAASADGGASFGKQRLDETRVIRRGKWRARIVNVVSVLAMLIVATIISSIITAVFYGSGEVGRQERYRDVVRSAIAVSRPNVELNGGGSSANAFFTMDLEGQLSKRVGDGQITLGRYAIRFFLNKALAPDIETDRSGESGYFYYPRHHPGAVEGKEAQRNAGAGREDAAEWEKLEKLPEGTVAEAYLSFGRFMTTDEVLQKLEPLNMEPVWFAVDAGQGSAMSDSSIMHRPIGFPYWPLWHAEDFTLTQYKEEKSGWFGKAVTKGGAYPALNAYGDGEARNENFVQTLQLLQRYSGIAETAAPFLLVDQALQYVEEHGVRLYGVVVTGPVKELLKLQEADWVSDLKVGEAALWNWRDR